MTKFPAVQSDSYKYERSALQAVWAELIVEELVRLGVRTFCLGPGSRNTPLTLAIARQKGISSTVHVDERALGFYAVGAAKASGCPSVIVTTSGTAVANLMPAVVEASMSYTPVIVITADRPFELLDTGANQAIKQSDIFGKYMRWSTTLGVADPLILPQTLLSTVDQLVFKSTGEMAGPVHFNCPFREPFLVEQIDQAQFLTYLNPVKEWLGKQGPYREDIRGVGMLSEPQLQGLFNRIRSCENGLVVVGRLMNQAEATAVSNFVRHLGWPVLLDPQSMIGKHELNHVVSSERYLSLQKEADCLLQFGERLTLKQAIPAKESIQILSVEEREDPHHRFKQRFVIDIAEFCQNGLECLSKSEFQSTEFTMTDAKVSGGDDFECQSVKSILQWMSKEWAFFIGNSLPIRWVEKLGLEQSMLVGANRGASGIDGLLASAAGFANASQKKTVLLLGDLSFFYDLTSLQFLREARHNVVVIILNNNGGQIFSRLPIARDHSHFETFFQTPLQLTFEKASDLFGIQYVSANDELSLKKALKEAERSGPILLEVFC